jgi:hypothetical protein
MRNSVRRVSDRPAHGARIAVVAANVAHDLAAQIGVVAAVIFAHGVLSLDVGGRERLILILAGGLAARGHDVRVLSLSPGGALRPQFAGIPTVDVAHDGKTRPSTWARIGRALALVSPDVAHTHNPAPFIDGAPAARIAGVRRVVHTKHGSNTRQGTTMSSGVDQ